MRTVDIGRLLDEGRASGYQKLLVLATALTIIFDGVDSQLLGVAIPALMREWQLPREAFAAVVASGLFGMMVGGAIGGVVGDRLGRRVALLGSVFVFGGLTCAIALVDAIGPLIALRFLAGLGLGGAMPNAAALASEYVPLRQRPFAVTLTVVCVPLGGALAGVVGAQVLPRFGWQTLFAVGGAMPVLLGVVLLRALPESPRFLARHRARWPELVRLLRRLGHDVRDGDDLVDPSEAAVRVSVRELATPRFRRDTAALVASFFCCLLAAYAGVSWLPSMLAGAGYDVASASTGLTVFNLGGVVGALAGAAAIARAGSRLTMLGMSAGAAAGALVLASMTIAPPPTLVVFALLAWTGGLINGTQTTMYALAAHVYPAAIRATGVGTAVAIGRVGGVVSSYAGSWALASGGSGYFMLLAVMMTLVFGALAAVRRHIPGAAAVGRPALAGVQPAGRS